MDEEVHGFVKEALPPLNIRVKSEDPFVPNGSDPSAFEGAAFSEKKHHHHRKHHKRPDVAERGMDEEVHGFVVDSLPPLNTRERSTMPFLPNGSNPSAFKGAFMARNRKDIAERGMDEDVWGFSTEAIPPLNVRSGEKEQMPWLMNGYKNQWAQVNNLAQAKPDIAERNMDSAWVHPFSSDQDVVLPTANPWTRPQYTPFMDNGKDNVYTFGQLEHQKGDIANHEVRPDVYVTVHKMLNPVALGRFREPRPDDAPEPERTWEDGAKPKEPEEEPYKFVKPKEVDEEAVMAKRKAEAAKNKAKAKAEKEKKDEKDAQPDEDAKDAPKPEKKKSTEEETPKEKEAKEQSEAEEKKAAEAAETEEKEKPKKAKKEKKEEEKQEEEKPAEEEKPEEKPKEEKKEEKKEEPKKEEPKKEEKKEEPKKEEKKESLAQIKAKDDEKKDEEKKEVAAPEKVHILEPTVYQDKANTNTPNLRTTFYDKKSEKKTI